MSPEAKLTSLDRIEKQPQEFKYSCNPQLNEYLKMIDHSLPQFGDNDVPLSRIPKLIGFESASGYSRVRNILVHSQKIKILSVDAAQQVNIAGYQREDILVMAALVQIWAQGETWDNIPYSLYHYVTHPSLKRAINNATDPYNPNRQRHHPNVDKRRNKFEENDRVKFILPGEIDLSAETVLEDSENFFQPITSRVSAEQEIEDQKPRIELSDERMRWLYIFLDYDSPIKPFPIDTISSTRLQYAGFTLEEAEAVFDELIQRKNGQDKIPDSDKTYYALKNAICEIMRARTKNKDNS